MEVIKTAIEGVVIIEPRIFEDSRGYFFESFSQREFEEKVGRVNFVQDNESKSSYGSDMSPAILSAHSCYCLHQTLLASISFVEMQQPPHYKS